jgi:hypothetical protein
MQPVPTGQVELNVQDGYHLRDQAPLLEYGLWLLLTVEVVECEGRVGTSCWLWFWLC